MKKWLKKNKVLLITFGVTTIVLLALALFQYAETRAISEPLYSFGTIGVLNVITFGVWIIMLLTILWKVFFPSKESVKNAFHVNDTNVDPSLNKMAEFITKDLKHRGVFANKDYMYNKDYIYKILLLEEFIIEKETSLGKSLIIAIKALFLLPNTQHTGGDLKKILIANDDEMAELITKELKKIGVKADKEYILNVLLSEELYKKSIKRKE